MHVLVTGANGYIGLRLTQALLEAGHEITAVIRDRRRFPVANFGENESRLHIAEADFLDAATLRDLPPQIDAAYYLIHSMGSGGDFARREEQCAASFSDAAKTLGWKRIIYLGGLAADEGPLSEHLSSRRRVEEILRGSGVPLTALRASIIVGSGSASFEIIRDLAEKLPVLVTPRWVHTACQPIAIRNVLDYLTAILQHPETAHGSYDIGGPDVMSYLGLIKGYCDVRGLKRIFLPTRLLSPRLSSAWLCLLTSTSFPLARSLVDSLTHETVCHDLKIREIIPLELLSYREAVERALARIAQNHVPSSWIDSLAAGTLSPRLFDAIKVPEHGVLTDTRVVPLTAPRGEVVSRIWSIGGAAGWPSMNWAWKLRGIADKFAGGIGIRRGRRHPEELHAGDSLDFWRVLLADRTKGRLMLYAEMKLPGEAWLEFSIEDAPSGGQMLRQTATFRPQGLLGRLYWLAVLPFHWLLFPRMARQLASGLRLARAGLPDTVNRDP
ncbi:MAG: SDR family oxidoreductase [Akkermansiaceae bacterium]|nr:SDR family oxidoreductase [Akkermansiaceae bacterium]MCU0778289.1 SDR family oxidoreductase [Akkermansiaceae bacterium]